MRFRHHRSDAIPGLAWCCRLQRGCDEVTVHHGRYAREGSGESSREISTGTPRGTWTGPEAKTR